MFDQVGLIQCPNQSKSLVRLIKQQALPDTNLVNLGIDVQIDFQLREYAQH